MIVDFAIALAWHNRKQLEDFLTAWGIGESTPPWLCLYQDTVKCGGARPKNEAIRKAVATKAPVVVVLDDDCYPTANESLDTFALWHAVALEPQPVEMFEAVTDPPSRGTPYSERTITMPVAASMGFWTNIGDHCAVRQLATNAAPMTFKFKTVFQRYFPLCAMNYAFKPALWFPFYHLVEDVGRFDDIWMGWMWQRHAYAQGYCFNLNGPLVRHVRQSNVWKNLINETQRLEYNETLWRDIALSQDHDYDSLRKLLPA